MEKIFVVHITDMGLFVVFSIVTAGLGGISVFEYFYRSYKLFRKRARARPLNARKSWVAFLKAQNFWAMTNGFFQLDFFHINITIVWLILAVELIM